MAVDVRIITEVVGAEGAKRELQGIQQGTVAAGEGAKKASLGFKALGLAMKGILPLLAADAIINGIKGILNATSDARETTQKFNAVFKDLADTTRDWAEIMAESLNRSSIEFEKFLSGFQGFFTALGFARDESAEMSKTMVQLGVDLAAFNNIAEDDAIDRLKSGIIGNHDALDALNVTINDAILSQELMNLGLAESSQKATESEKVMARLSIILRQTADAHGTAKRESGGFASQMKGLQAAVLDVMVALGETGLIDVITRLVKQFTVLLKVIAETIDFFVALAKDPIAALKQLGEAIHEWAIETIERWLDNLKILGEAMGNLLRGEFKEMIKTLGQFNRGVEKVKKSTDDHTAAIKKEDRALKAQQQTMRQRIDQFEDMIDRQKEAERAAQERSEAEQAADEQSIESAKKVAQEKIAAERQVGDEARRVADERCGYERVVDECGNESFRKRTEQSKRFRKETVADLGFIKIQACREIEEQVKCTEEGQQIITTGWDKVVKETLSGQEFLSDGLMEILRSLVSGYDRAYDSMLAQGHKFKELIAAIVKETVDTLTAIFQPGIPIPLKLTIGGEGIPGEFGIGSLLGPLLGLIIPGPLGGILGPLVGLIPGLDDILENIGDLVKDFGDFFGDLFDDLFGWLFQRGGDFVTSRPMLIGVGEGAPERVRITPLGAHGGSDGATVVFQGPTVMDEIGLRRFTRTLQREMRRREARGG